MTAGIGFGDENNKSRVFRISRDHCLYVMRDFPLILLANCFIVSKSQKLGRFKVKNDQNLFVSLPIFDPF
jgi:hypothetical protein